jgi:hypothetical protein
MAFGNQLLYGVLDAFAPEDEDDIRKHEQDAVPQQIHISLGKTAHQMEILWATRIYTRSELYYGETEKDMNQKAKIKLDILSHSNSRGSRYWHRAILDNLKPDHRHYYYITSGKVRSETYHFQTIRNTTTWSPKFLVYGDLMTNSKSLPYILKEGHNRYDAIFHVGDFAYDLHSEEGRRGDVFMNSLQPLAAYVPYIGIAGDHEREGSYAHYRYRFALPGVPWPIPEERMYYSQDIGNVHILAYNPQVYLFSQDLIDEQYNWMLADLRLAHRNRRKVPWIIVLGHRPLYCTHYYPDDCQFEDSVVRAGVEDLFYYFGVDLVIQGHEHMYERSYPMYKSKPTAKHYINPKAPVYIISGSTGNEYVTDDLPADKNVNDWSAFLISEKDKESVSRVQVLNATHLSYQQVLTASDTLLDKFTIVQHRHGPFGNLKKFMPIEMESINMIDLAAMQKTFSKSIRLNYLSSLLMFLIAGFLTVWMVLRQIAICRRENHLDIITSENVLVKMA